MNYNKGDVVKLRRYKDLQCMYQTDKYGTPFMPFGINPVMVQFYGSSVEISSFGVFKSLDGCTAFRFKEIPGYVFPEEAIEKVESVCFSI